MPIARVPVVGSVGPLPARDRDEGLYRCGIVLADVDGDTGFGAPVGVVLGVEANHG